MSLIEEALRRVQDPNTPKAKAAPKPPKTDAEQPALSPHSWTPTSPSPIVTPTSAPVNPNVALVVAVAVLGLTVALIAGGAVWFRRALHGTQPLPDSTQTQLPSGEPALETAAPTPVERRGAPRSGETFVLTGVVEGSGEPYAMIDGALVRVGEQVRDATLLEIANGAVRLRRADGSETIVRVSR